MYYNQRRYEGKVCVVTGAAAGLGLDMTRRLVEEGAVVAAMGVRKENLEREFSGNDSVFIVKCDVSIKSEVDIAIDSIIKHFGHIDVVFNNAGIIGRHSLLESTEEEWRKVIDVNLNGVFFVSQAVLRHMVGANIKGVIVNISSVASEIVSPNTGAYSASKGGVSMFTKFAALEMAPYGIRVCAVGPGTSATRLTEATRNNPERSEMFLRNIPLKRFAEPEEITCVSLFLGSDEASYCTGQTWLVDGGNTLF